MKQRVGLVLGVVGLLLCACAPEAEDRETSGAEEGQATQEVGGGQDAGMAAGTALRPGFVWTNGTPVTSAEFSTLDQAQVDAVRGSGGVWQPTVDPIEVTGGLGLWSRRLRGGAPISGNAAFEVSDTTGACTIRGQCTANDAVIFNSTAGFNGVATFSGGASIVSAATVSGAGTIRTPGSSLILNDSTSPNRNPAVAFTNRTLRWVLLGSSAVAGDMPAPFLGAIFFFNNIQVSATIELLLNHNVEYSQFSFSLLPGLPHTALPQFLPQVMLVEVDADAGVTATRIAAQSISTPPSVAAYDAGASYSVNVTPFVPNINRRYILQLTNESGTNSKAQLMLRGIKANGNVVFFGRTGEL